MSKSGLIELIAEQSGFTKKDSEVALKSVLGAFGAALEQGEKVSIVGFGTFEVKERKARIGHNPTTRQEIQIPACKAVTFKASKNLKDRVNK